MTIIWKHSVFFQNFLAHEYDTITCKIGDLSEKDLRTATIGPIVTIGSIAQYMSEGDSSFNISETNLQSDVSDKDFAEIEDRKSFFQAVQSELNAKKQKMFKDAEIIENILDSSNFSDVLTVRILNNLKSLGCPEICPWCGIACCGSSHCNNKYHEYKKCNENQNNKHSCQFHRDISIIGIIVHNTDTLANRGDCPEIIAQKVKWVDNFNMFGKGEGTRIPYDYYKETWRIESAAEDKDAQKGYFWQWFLAQVTLVIFSIL